VHRVVEILVGKMWAAQLQSTGDALKKGRALLNRQAAGGGHDDLKLIVTEGEHRVTSSPNRGFGSWAPVAESVTGGIPLRAMKWTRDDAIRTRCGGNPVAIRVLFRSNNS
jgi:hypothetical protein